MSPEIALVAYLGIIFFLFWKDSKQNPGSSISLWIPLIWFIIIGSRNFSQWINLGAPLENPDQYIEGSSVDRIVFGTLMFIGIIVLLRRKVDIGVILRNNKAIICLFVYAGISMFWSDFPAVTIKRWFKAIGNLIMVLIVLTDSNQKEAVKTIFKRSAFILVPMSVLFIKYFPQYGRGYSKYTWDVYYTGVSTGKNELGQICFIGGLYIVWNLVTSLKDKKDKPFFNTEVVSHGFILMMVFYLFARANSATSFVCFFIGILLILSLNISFAKRNLGKIVLFFIFIILSYTIYMEEYNIGGFAQYVGRDATITGRTDLWKNLIKMGTNPIVGTGFESFWLGSRLEKLWDMYFWRPNQAHNGYLELYLNLGIVGLFILCGIIVSSYQRIQQYFLLDPDMASLRSTFFFPILLFNVTEAAFKGIHFIWFVFLLVSIDYCKKVENKICIKKTTRA